MSQALSSSEKKRYKGIPVDGKALIIRNFASLINGKKAPYPLYKNDMVMKLADCIKFLDYLLCLSIAIHNLNHLSDRMILDSDFKFYPQCLNSTEDLKSMDNLKESSSSSIIL